VLVTPRQRPAQRALAAAMGRAAHLGRPADIAATAPMTVRVRPAVCRQVREVPSPAASTLSLVRAEASYAIPLGFPHVSLVTIAQLTGFSWSRANLTNAHVPAKRLQQPRLSSPTPSQASQVTTTTRAAGALAGIDSKTRWILPRSCDGQSSLEVASGLHR